MKLDNDKIDILVSHITKNWEENLRKIYTYHFSMTQMKKSAIEFFEKDKYFKSLQLNIEEFLGEGENDFLSRPASADFRILSAMLRKKLEDPSRITSAMIIMTGDKFGI